MSETLNFVPKRAEAAGNAQTDVQATWVWDENQPPSGVNPAGWSEQRLTRFKFGHHPNGLQFAGVSGQ